MKTYLRKNNPRKKLMTKIYGKKESLKMSLSAQNKMYLKGRR